MTENHRQRGLAALAILIVLLLMIVFASAASYYLLRRAGANIKSLSLPLPLPQASQSPSAQPAVSDSGAVETIEGEIEGTVIESLDRDIDALNSSASSL